MEGIRLQHFIHQKVGKLSDALKQYETGNALVYTFTKPRSLFVGTVPRQCAVIWRYPKHEELYISSSGCTFFTWNHLVEVFVVTAVVMYKFQLPETDVLVKFHIFDPIKFCSSIKVDELHDKMARAVKQFMTDHEEDNFESSAFQLYQAEALFKLSRMFHVYGVSIDGFTPQVRLKY